MPELSRIVRFAINPPAASPTRAGGPAIEPGAGTGPGPREGAGGVAARPGDAHNGFAGNPSMRGLGRHYELTITCRGEVNPATGYLIDIKDIDRAVRAQAVPLIARACHERPDAEPGELLPALIAALGPALGSHLPADRRPELVRIFWHLSPFYGVGMETRDTGTVLLRQRFDFAAAHRLHSPLLSDEENRRTFGKCNNPSGHGHNYQVEPCVAVPLAPAPAGTQPFTLADLERLTDQSLIDPFDHKHLNVDTAEFDPTPRRSPTGDAPAGVIPSVENIAKVFFDRLSAAIAREAATIPAWKGVALRSMTVWETDRTSCVWPG